MLTSLLDSCNHKSKLREDLTVTGPEVNIRLEGFEEGTEHLMSQ